MRLNQMVNYNEKVWGMVERKWRYKVDVIK